MLEVSFCHVKWGRGKTSSLQPEPDLPFPLPREVWYFQFSSVQFSHSVVSDSLRTHGLQHARPPCPSPTPGAYSNSCPLSCWCHPTISSFVVPFSSCLQPFPASGSFPLSQFSLETKPWNKAHWNKALRYIIVCVLPSHFSHIQLLVTSWILAHQVPLWVGFSRQQYWSRFHRVFLTQGSKLSLLCLLHCSLPLASPGEPLPQSHLIAIPFWYLSTKLWNYLVISHDYDQ